MPNDFIGAGIVLASVAHSDYERLIKFGIPESERLSWRQTETRESAGFVSLVNELGYEYSTESEVQELYVGIPEESTNLADAFSRFMTNLARDTNRPPDSVNRPQVLILNLMPFYLSVTLLDKIARGIFLKDHDEFLRQFETIVVLLRNIDWLLKSKVFSDATQQGKLVKDVWALDIRCFAAKFHRDSSAPRQIMVTRNAFRAVLDTDINRIYRSLIFETNSYIGHFGLPSSHVRTHYDLSEFIKRDNVWEYLLQCFEELIDNADSLLLIGIGMERGVIQKMGDQLMSLLGERITIIFRQPDIDSEPVIPPNWSVNFHMAIVVTDIICTGTTVDPCIQQLQNDNKQNRLIKIFAIASMQNSPPMLSRVPVRAGVQIRRKFYSPNPDECHLCKIAQPLREVKKAGDFCYLAQGQLTPFDFWEMVTDAHALERDVTDAHGRQLAYRINTQKLVDRYARWLENVIKSRFVGTWPGSKVDVICTVNEPTGAAFTELVKKSLSVSRVVKLGREQLVRCTSTGGLPDGVKNPFKPSDHILVVDDGMNTGNTVSQLIKYCKAAGNIPIGGLVLDSRLDETEMRVLTAKMSRNRLVALYTWPRTGHPIDS